MRALLIIAAILIGFISGFSASVDAATSVNDPRFLYQSELAQHNVTSAWDITTGGPVIVAVLDTGVQWNHPDLTAKVIQPGWSYIGGPALDDAYNWGHGTQVAGIISASTNNGMGIAGVSWGARILPVKVCRADGWCEPADEAVGLRWAVANGAKIVNMSFSQEPYHPEMAAAVAEAQAAGVVLVAAAGNVVNGTGRCDSCPHYPSAYSGVISVGGAESTNTVLWMSDRAAPVDLIAGGDAVQTTACFIQYSGGPCPWVYPAYYQQNAGTPVYLGVSGTSYSAALVSGTVALMLTVNPYLTPAEVKSILTQTAIPVVGPGAGAGALDARAAVQMAKDRVPPQCR